jgi:hypothetical protein
MMFGDVMDDDVAAVICMTVLMLLSLPRAIGCLLRARKAVMNR